jgi:hypothetical protein
MAKSKGKVQGCRQFQMRKCKTCGKEMCRINWTDYAYKIQTRSNGKTYAYFCSYTCMRKARLDGLVKEDGKPFKERDFK